MLGSNCAKAALLPTVINTRNVRVLTLAIVTAVNLINFIIITVFSDWRANLFDPDDRRAAFAVTGSGLTAGVESFFSDIVSDADARVPIEGASSPGQKEVKTGTGTGRQPTRR